MKELKIFFLLGIMFVGFNIMSFAEKEAVVLEPNENIKTAENIGSKDLQIRMNGVLLEFPNIDQLANEKTMTYVPIKYVVEEMGASISWEQSSLTTIINRDDIEIKAKLNENYILVNDEKI